MKLKKKLMNENELLDLTGKLLDSFVFRNKFTISAFGKVLIATKQHGQISITILSMEEKPKSYMWKELNMVEKASIAHQMRRFYDTLVKPNIPE